MRDDSFVVFSTPSPISNVLEVAWGKNFRNVVCHLMFPIIVQSLEWITIHSIKYSNQLCFESAY